MIVSENRRVPDFFIIGAPKTGTTALDYYLGQHPDIFMCRKEAHYFCKDFPHNVNFNSFEDYQGLFQLIKNEKITGESSVWYLYSNDAVPEILKLNSQAKFIVMLRDPIKAAQALHGQLLLDLREDVLDFEKAWRLQELRQQGKNLPLNTREPKHLLYKKVCKWSPQIKRLLNNVAPENVNIIIMEDFFSDVDSGYRSVLEFIGATPLALDRYEKINGSKVLKSMFLLKLSGEFPLKHPYVTRVAKTLVNVIGLKPGRALNRYVKNGNLLMKKRPDISRKFKDELISIFESDVSELQDILNIPLREYWLK